MKDKSYLRGLLEYNGWAKKELLAALPQEDDGAARIQRGDKVRILPQWQDKGDEKFEWIALEDEDGGRVRIMATNTGLPLPPNEIVNTSMIEKITTIDM